MCWIDFIQCEKNVLNGIDCVVFVEVEEVLQVVNKNIPCRILFRAFLRQCMDQQRDSPSIYYAHYPLE